MPVEVIIAIVAVVAWRIIAGLRIPVLSALLRGIWNLCFKITSFIPFFGWCAHFIIADTAEEKQQKADFVEVGEGADSLVSGAFSGGSEKTDIRPATSSMTATAMHTVFAEKATWCTSGAKMALSGLWILIFCDKGQNQGQCPWFSFFIF